MAKVVANENEDFESLLRRFNRQVQQSGILAEVRHREYYEKPSTIRNRKRKAFERKLLKKQRKLQARNNY